MSNIACSLSGMTNAMVWHALMFYVFSVLNWTSDITRPDCVLAVGPASVIVIVGS